MGEASRSIYRSRRHRVADITLYGEGFPEGIRCGLSTFNVWKARSCFGYSSEDEEGEEEEEDESFSNEEDTEFHENSFDGDDYEDDAHESSDTLKYYTKAEPVSCYCSASHTDNISTDEHHYCLQDNQSFIKSLQLSDSGADLTEVSCCGDSAWKKYWTSNGERLIWKSWIAKYSDYINPEYLETIQAYSEEGTAPTTSIANPPSQDFCDCSASLVLDQGISLLQVKETTPEPKQQATIEIQEKNRMLIRNLSYSDSYEKISREMEGWNQLSPVSNDCETEAERLLSSRCASRTGSSARTVDSMTNVTRLTVSSFDLSESSKHSDSFSPVSSIQSSVTSTSSEEAENENADNEQQQQWNVLWMQHYEEVYLKNYKKFILDYNSEKKTESMDENMECVDCDDSDNILVEEDNPEIDYINSISDEEEMMRLGIPLHFGNSKEKPSKDASYTNRSYVAVAKTAMKPQSSRTRKFLPQNFITTTRLDKSDDEKPVEISSKLRIVEADTPNGISSAFKSVGLQIQLDKTKSFRSTIEYYKNYQKCANRSLQKQECRSIPPKTTQVAKHIHFDDDGKVIPDEISDTDNVNEKDEEQVSEKLKRLKPRDEKNLPEEIKNNMGLLKFWYRRHSLFSLYDSGIKLDEESWFSVTPEAIAKETANLCKCNVVIDAFCGAGGNTIQFAKTCEKVIAIDIDANKIRLAKHNARVYGVESKIEFLVGDFLEMAPSLKGDVIFLSPPWGGPDYVNLKVYDLCKLLPVPFDELYKKAKQVASNMAFFLPKNSNIYSIYDVIDEDKEVEIVRNVLKGKPVALTAYYGKDLVDRLRENHKEGNQ